ncbi:MAG: hypothetical protein IEMM0008_0822 [bacterium]|nr:MAG: hypothetical protein IEMM0008_0822 [bacterium]
MSLRPLDMQVVLSQMDYAGADYLKAYTAPRKEQIYHEAHFIRRSRDADQKVLDLPEELSEDQETYIDPHDEDSDRKKGAKLNKQMKSRVHKQDSPFSHEEEGKGQYIDVLR